MRRVVIIIMFFVVWTSYLSLNAKLINANPSSYSSYLATLVAGDTLSLSSGTYVNNLTLNTRVGTATDPIVIIGSGNATNFQAQSCCNTISLTKCEYLIIKNLQLDGMNQAVDAVKAEGTIGNYAHHITIEYLNIINYGNNQQIVGISTKCPAWNWVIRKNRIIGAGTGMYLGNSDGTKPFVNGIIENNFIASTIGYNIEIKHQLNGERELLPETSVNGKTVLRYNVFSKDANSSTGGSARPNLLVGGFATTGFGSLDYYEIYSNFFYNNPVEALFQGTGKIMLYNNIFVNHFDPSGFRAVYITPQNGVSPQDIKIFHNTVWTANNSGAIRLYNPDINFKQYCYSNAVFADAPITNFTDILNNVTDTYTNASNYVVSATTDISTLNLYPQTGKLSGTITPSTLFQSNTDWDKDFNKDSYTWTYRGAYSGSGTNNGWKLQLDTMFIPKIAPTSNVWKVGPSRTYTKPSQVASLVKSGDTIEIDAGVYSGDVAYWSASNLVIKGVGGFAHLKASGKNYGGKAIWVIGGNNVTVEWIEFSECTVIDQNGAGIRFEGKNLNVRHCYFHNNDDGILCGAMAQSSLLIEYTEFAYNGFGDGYSHNLYIGHIDTLTFRYNYTHHANIGHELKSRANVNIITYNRLSDESTGTASRSIDLPNGGTALIMGNIIEQGPQTQNSNILGYGLEGLTNTSAHEVYIINNTFINNLSKGNFVQVQNGTSLLKMNNNIFAGLGSILVGTPTLLDSASNFNNTNISSFNFQNTSTYDYHLTQNSIAIDRGLDLGISNGLSLKPLNEYSHPFSYTSRTSNCPIDIGAYEFAKLGVDSIGGVFGYLSVCDISKDYFYSIKKQQSPIIWEVTGGNIIGNNNKDSVLVNWLTKGNGQLKLIRNNGTPCADSVEKVVKISSPAFYSRDIALCAGDSIAGAKVQRDTIINRRYYSYIGCDSNVTLNVKINLSAKFEKDTVIYLSETYKNKKYDTIGTFKNENKFTKGAYSGCDSIFTENIIVKAKSSVEEDLNFANLLVSPNPANEIINLNLKDITYNQIELIDLFSKVIYKTSFEQINSNSIQLNSKELDSGTYFVKINSNNIFKFIKIIVIH
ncbi:MAG: T9SS type A sorting domain-containing protein [Candidatus Kapabacteria bacterium]|nr:T9SS type A sorting domain-containing protein [Candidatus Kapabacteria bacterium]